MILEDRDGNRHEATEEERAELDRAGYRLALKGPPAWTPTHRISGEHGQIDVMLVADSRGEGPAYTREEWGTESPADHERSAGGEWTFQGRPFTGRVTPVL